MHILVIALGGNALLDPSGEQSLSTEKNNMSKMAESIISLQKDYNIIITHGNGSQVGDELVRGEHAKGYVMEMPLYALNAETQASIGTVIETSLRNSMKGPRTGVCVILSHVLVDSKDLAFNKPTKQIGPFYTKRELEKELRLDRFQYIRHGNQYRRVVPSPKPIQILEMGAIRDSIKGNVVITCGGGGIPVVMSGKTIKGVDAVIDKDLTTELLASTVGAESMVILTNVPYVYTDYKRRRGAIRDIRTDELKRMLDTFEEGTIRPKVEACIRFIENGGHEAFIGSIFKLRDILGGRSGTHIH